MCTGFTQKSLYLGLAEVRQAAVPASLGGVAGARRAGARGGEVRNGWG